MGGLWLACSATAYSQNGGGYWKRLQKTHPETTLEALQQTSPATSQIPSGQPEVAACRLALVYKGKTRKISEGIVRRMQAIGLKKGSIRQFKEEVLFASEGQEVWLPMKASLVDQLELEVRAEEPVLLYTTVLQGDNVFSQEQRVTLLVEDFEAK